jgi:RND superfamily putative drug exporter
MSNTPRNEEQDKNTHRPGTFWQLYGRLVYRWRWIFVIVWALVLLAAIPFANALPSVLHNRGYTIPNSESIQVSNILASTFRQPTTLVLVVFQSKSVPVTDPAYQQELKAFLSRMKTFPHVVSTTQGDVGRDTRSTFVALGFDQDQDTVASAIPELRQALASVATGPAEAFLTGEPAVNSEIQLDTAANTELAEIIALPATLLVLLLVFGTLVSAGLPLLLAGVAVVTTLATIYLIALHIETSIFVQSIASIIGLGLSIDYSLILLYRFREELARKSTVEEAITVTVATAGEAVLFSGITVVIGFAGLLLMGIQVMTSFGIGGIVIASTAVLVALTLLPALFSILGPRVNALPLLPRFAARRTQKNNRKRLGRFWLRLAGMIQRRPLVVIGCTLALLLLLAWPALALNPGLPGVSALPSNSEARRGIEIVRAQFPDLNDNPLTIVVRTTDGSSPLTSENVARLDALTQWIGNQAHVTEAVSLTRFPKAQNTRPLTLAQLQQLYSTGQYRSSPPLKAFVDATTQGDATLITVKSDTIAGSSSDQVLIDQLRSVKPSLKQGFVLLVGGARVVDLDFNRGLYHNFLYAFVFILIATYVLLFITFRSIFLPLKAILMNVISVAAAYGVVVWVFQEGHLQEMLNFQTDGSIDRFVPLLLFCTLFGLSMDYEVFLLSRMREAWLSSGNNARAVAIGLQKTGGVITSAAMLFVLVSGAFLFTSLIVTKELGLGITASIIVDATIIRSLLVPATMHILGRWNWWRPSVFSLFGKRKSANSHEETFQTILTCGHPWRPHAQFCPVCGKVIV